MEKIDRSMLLNILDDRLDEEEITELCFSLRAEYPMDSTKRVMARYLIEYVERRDKLSELVALCQRMRPDVNLGSVIPAPSLPPLTDKITERVMRETRERLVVLLKSADTQMRHLDYSAGVISNFVSCFDELAANGLDHGCEKRDDPIEITIDITHMYATVTVSNLSGKQFDVASLIEQQVSALRANPATRRGRGLIAAFERSDELFSLTNNTAVKATLYREAVRLQVLDIEDLTIIEVSGGIDNPSINRRIEAKVRQCTSPRLIFHVPMRDKVDQRKPGTEAMTAFLDTHNEFWAKDRKLAVFVGTLDRGELDLFFPAQFMAWSWKSALEAVGRLDLETHIDALCAQGVLKAQ